MDISRNCLRHLCVATLVLALAGCASQSPPKPDEAKVKQFVSRGYLTDDRFPVSTTFATWTAGGDTFDVALTVPANPASFPLVIYLPALGESRSAGEAWRTAWAQGGYAVLSLQLLAEDETAWSSTKARAGDFTLLARERYSTKKMVVRLAALQNAWRELSRRRSQGEKLLEQIDLSRVAIAGYDLGAYTAMVVAGEHLRGGTSPEQQIPIRAVIALSPYADFSGAAFRSRYQSIRGPVLSITSDDDWDTLGLVTSPSIRKAPFEYMPEGDKYLLAMSRLSHLALGGGNQQDGSDDPQRMEKHESPSRGGSQSGGHGGHHFGEHGSHGNAGGDAARGGQERNGYAATSVLSPTARAIGVAAIQGVSSAFLDAYMKQDPIAQEWLNKDAKRWLGESGELRKK